jgi:hypothetical protein
MSSGVVMTEHFSSPQWVDLVRGLAADEVRGAMNTHLRDGCPACVKAYRLWHGMALFAGEERALTPPEDAVRVAKSYLAQHRIAHGAVPPATERPFASAIIATLLFDSLQAVPAGVRASVASYSRHLLFGAQSLAIDLHIDAGSRPGSFMLAGQIIDKSSPDGPFARATVSLVDGDITVSTFETNEFGEFQCTFELRQNMKLQVALQHEIVALPLEVLFDPSSPPSSRDEE